MKSDYMNAQDVHEYLKIPKSTIYYLVTRGEIPHMKVDGKLIFSRNELESWLASYMMKAKLFSQDQNKETDHVRP